MVSHFEIIFGTQYNTFLTHTQFAGVQPKETDIIYFTKVKYHAGDHVKYFRLFWKILMPLLKMFNFNLCDIIDARGHGGQQISF